MQHHPQLSLFLVGIRWYFRVERAEFSTCGHDVIEGRYIALHVSLVCVIEE